MFASIPKIVIHDTGFEEVQGAPLQVEAKTDGLYFNFSPSEEHNLTIFNRIGQPVTTIAIPNGTASIQIPTFLLTGFYFVRLGNEMAKFVVTQ